MTKSFAKHLETRQAKRSARPVLLLLCLLMGGAWNSGTAPKEDLAECRNLSSGTTPARSLLPGPQPAFSILISTKNPKAARPLHVQIGGLLPGQPLTFRKIQWNFHNAASLFNRTWGRSATALYITSGRKTITLTLTDIGGLKTELSCWIDIA
jgi:hypothetical protein